MILDYYGGNSQCNIVAWAINDPDCTTGNCYTGTCNVQNYICYNDSPDYGIASILLNLGGLSNSCGQWVLSQNSVYNEIYGGRPFIIRWQWDGGGGHFLVVYAYNGGTLYLHDPWDGSITGSYAWVVDGSNHEWDWTVSLNYTSPGYVNIGHNSGNGVNNSVEFLGCYNNQEMHGYATCLGDWWVNPCAWTSSCSTGWDYNPNDYYYTGEDCSFCD
jgi:hypothetical protein